MSTGPDLFVICKSCGSEVSPYITECPYCGKRLRKRAPKLDRAGAPQRSQAHRRGPQLSLGRLRNGEIPGIRADNRPLLSFLLVAVGLVGCLLWRSGLVNLTDLVVFGKPWSEAWRIVTAAFTFQNTGYAFAALGATALFGWLLEARHGRLAVLVIWSAGAFGGIAVTAALESFPLVFGCGGGGIALLVAWALPDLLELRAGREVEGDVFGAAVFFAVLSLMPLAAPHQASWIADGVGVLSGLALGAVLLRSARR